MSCCRSASFPQGRPVSRPAICSNCHASIKNKTTDALSERMKLETRPGTYKVTLSVVCSCGYRNMVPVVLSKH